MSLAVGARLGPYEILAPLGAGGMGEVWKARDTKLGRDVALKILPTAFAHDPERLARFEREAQVLASLDHPHIAAIHSLDEHEGVHYLVLELVAGETLAERLTGGPLSVGEALRVALQIADALEAAHGHGIIHRDLKPANVKLTAQGQVKVLDFGLAKALEPLTRPAGSLSPAGGEGWGEGTIGTQSPTMTSPAMTRAGVILGTAAYMSPEQARGRPVDKRTDIWAFGCVLYELLTGRPAFGGETVTDIVAAIMTREPDWAALPVETLSGVQALLRRCLQKDVACRLRDVGDARIEIDEALAKPPQPVADRSVAELRGASSRRTIALILSASVVATGLTALVIWTLMARSQSVSSPIARVLISVEPAERLLSGYVRDRTLGQGRPTRTAVALSPDGRHLVYSAERAGRVQLYLRALDELQATPIPETEDASNPFFSPDGQWIGFHADGALKKVPLSGGPVVTLCAIDLVFGASWGPEDVIVFARSGREGLWQIPAAGGTPTLVTKLDSDAGEVSHRLPQLLPDGQTVLFTVTKDLFPRWDDTLVVAQSLVTGERKVLIQGGADARYVPTGHLVYVRRGTLMAAPFDLRRLEVGQGAVGLVGDVMQAANIEPNQLDTGAGQFAVSESGSLVYVSGGIFQEGRRSLLWVGRTGVSEEALRVPAQPYVAPRLSPDGRRVAVFTVGPTGDIWVHDIPRGTLTRLAMDGQENFPIWTPDGSRVTFSSAVAGPTALFWRKPDGSSPAERLTTTEQYSRFPGSWAPDGRALAFLENAAGTTAYDIWVLPREGDERPQPVIKTRFNETHPEFSPDGHWLAYASDESGRNQVYVQPYPGLGLREQISTDGGTAPAWRRDGQELFYVVDASGDGPLKTRVMAVPITTQPRLAAGTPRVLFEGAYRVSGLIRAYDVTPDGRRFLMVQEMPQPPGSVTQMVLVLNWFGELKRRVPTKSSADVLNWIAGLKK